jgi:hypothetical protein
MGYTLENAPTFSVPLYMVGGAWKNVHDTRGRPQKTMVHGTVVPLHNHCSEIASALLSADTPNVLPNTSGGANATIPVYTVSVLASGGVNTDWRPNISGGVYAAIAASVAGTHQKQNNIGLPDLMVSLLLFLFANEVFCRCC